MVKSKGLRITVSKAFNNPDKVVYYTVRIYRNNERFFMIDIPKIDADSDKPRSIETIKAIALKTFIQERGE